MSKIQLFMEREGEMNKEKLIEFCSKDCKNNIHSHCHEIWNGLGFQVICNCSCHKKVEMLDENSSLSNITNSPSVRSGKYVY
jgi:hypothetical protein